jgi:hypothetical protein
MRTRMRKRRSWIGTLVVLQMLALVVITMTTCTLGLLDLVAYQVLSNEPSMLYLGYRDSAVNGFGAARLGTTTGAMEVFRKTVAEANTSGCSLSVVMSTYPKVYFTAESPNRVMSIATVGFEPEQCFLSDPAVATDCLRYCGGAVYWSTLYVLHVGTIVSAGAALTLGNGYIESFDVDWTPYPDRIFYIGLRQYDGEAQFGIVAINADNTNVVRLWTIGHYVTSNLQLVDGYLYFVTQSPNGIYRIAADGSEPTPTLLLTPTAAPQAVAYDKVDGSLYWMEVDESTPRRIMKAGPGQTSGTLLLDYLPSIDPNGFSIYHP